MELPLLRDLGLILVCGAAFMLGARLARGPSIVAYLAAGLFLGPLTGLLEVHESLELISEMGIALLLFLVGLELSFEKVRHVGRVALLAGAGQIAVSAAGGFGLGLLLGFDPGTAGFLALALTFSSTVVVVKLLDEKRELDSLHGRIAIGVLLVQDVVVIVALTFLAGLGRGGEATGAGTLGGLLFSFAGMGLLLALALASARYVLPPLFGWISASLEAMFIWSLCWCFLFILGAELLHLSVELGAFLAGISLAQLPYNHELRRRVHPLMNFFIAVFFVALGTRIDPVGAAAYWREAAAFSVLVLVGKPAAIHWLARRLGHSRETSFRSGLTLAQISEFSFILAALGVEVGVVGDEVLSIVGLAGLATISISAYLILYDRRLWEAGVRRGLLRRPAALPASAAPPTSTAAAEAPPKPEGHVIVVGMNALGRRLVAELARREVPVTAVDTDPAKLRDVPATTVLGNVDDPAVLEEAGVDGARLVVSALQIEEVNNLLAWRCRKGGVPCSIHAFDRSVLSELREIGADHLIYSKHAALRQIAGELRAHGVIGG